VIGQEPTIHPPFLWYYSGWTREGAPKVAFGIKPLVFSPTIDQRDNASETVVKSLALDGTTTTGLAHFPVEAVNTVEVSNNTDVGLAQDVIDEYQNLKKYFERPRLYASTTASTRGNLVTYNVNNPVANFWPASALTRLLGMFGYRATVKFTVTLASTPFQQGLVAASFQYGCNSFTAVNLARSNFPALVTNIPHVLLDFAEHTVAELVVPYIVPL
jgi:hypothetical protein